MQLKHAIMKYFSFILICLFSYNTLSAEELDSTEYKRTIEGSISFGVNVNKFSVGHSSAGEKNRTGINLRFELNIPLNNKVGITTGAGIEHKGSIDDEYDGERRDLVYIQIPALASYRFFPEKKFNVDLAFGPYVAFGIEGNPFDFIGDTFVNDDYSWVYEGDSAPLYFADFIKKFDSGLIGSVGVSYKRLKLNFRYEYGLVNISKIKDIDIRNRGWSINIGYTIPF